VQAEDDALMSSSFARAYLREFIGQKKVKENLRSPVEAAKSARARPWTTFFYMVRRDWERRRWPPIIANEMGVALSAKAGPAIQIKGDLTAILTQHCVTGRYCSDEVHRLQPALEEILYRRWERLQARHHSSEGHQHGRTPLT